MKQQRSIKPITLHRRQQAGDALLDALIAMLLASVVGLGPVYVASRGAVAKAQAAYQNMAVVEMRKLLAVHGSALCVEPHTVIIKEDRLNAAGRIGLSFDPDAVFTNDPLNPLIRILTDGTFTFTCTTRLTSGIMIGGHAVDPSITGSGSAKTVSLSVTSSEKFGGSGTITITQGGV